MSIYYQDTNFYYFRKPAGLPSTFGKEKSFLDYMLDSIDVPPDKGDTPRSGERVCYAKTFPLSIIQSLTAFFGKDKEFGLLNRLDNDTSGLLYFAKNPRTYRDFKHLQSAGKLKKFYIAEVYGDISNAPLMKGGAEGNEAGGSYSGGGSQEKHYIDYNPNLKTLARELRNNQTQADSHPSKKGVITTPIAHHRYNPDRMVVIQSSQDEKKTKGQIHHVSTSILEFEFLPTTRTSVLLIQITKGVRHQIRSHLASIGHPICGDKLYTKSGGQTYETLQLFSVGLST